MTLWTSETEEALNSGGIDGMVELYDELEENKIKIVK